MDSIDNHDKKFYSEHVYFIESGKIKGFQQLLAGGHRLILFIYLYLWELTLKLSSAWFGLGIPEFSLTISLTELKNID